MTVATTTPRFGLAPSQLAGAVDLAAMRVAQDLVDQLDDPNCLGFTARVRTVRGIQSAADVIGLRTIVAGAFSVGVQHVEISMDPYDASIAIVTVSFPLADGTHPLAQPNIWTRPTINAETGILVHGRLLDGGPVHTRAYDRVEGCKLWWFSGSTGKGKSAALDRTLVELCSTGLFVPLIIDMKGGASLADWRPYVEHFIDAHPDDAGSVYAARRLVHGFRAMAGYRAMALGRMLRYDENGDDAGAAKVWPIDAAHPIPLLIIEECPDLWTSAGRSTVADAEHVSRNIRSQQMAMILASQDTSVGVPAKSTGAMGGSNTMRKQLRDNGNVIIFKNAKEAGTQAGESALEKIDPSAIPNISGANKVVTTLGEPALLNRSAYVPNVTKAIQDWATFPELDEGSATALRDGMERFDEWQKPSRPLIVAGVDLTKPELQGASGVQELIVSYLKSEPARRIDILTHVQKTVPEHTDDALGHHLKAMLAAGTIVQPVKRGAYQLPDAKENEAA